MILTRSANATPRPCRAKNFVLKVKAYQHLDFNEFVELVPALLYYMCVQRIQKIPEGIFADWNSEMFYTLWQRYYQYPTTSVLILLAVNYFAEALDTHHDLWTLSCYNTCMLSCSSSFLWMLMLLLPLRRNTSDRSVLSSCHLHHYLVTSIDRCSPAARYEDDVVTWRQKLTIATTVC